jgi:hypothetical protein
MMGLIISCLLAYAGTVFVFGVLRITIIDNHGANIFFCLALNMLAPVTMLCIEVSILFKYGIIMFEVIVLILTNSLQKNK